MIYPRAAAFRIPLFTAFLALALVGCGGESGNPPVNKAPHFGSVINPQVPENTRAVFRVPATDPEGGDLVFSLVGGADAALFSIDGGTGELAFLNAPDFENPLDADSDNDYELELGVADSQGKEASQTITVTVTDRNEAPEITSSQTASVPEGSLTAYTPSVNDPDGDTLNYSLEGGADAALFSIDSGTGVIRFQSAPDFEAPGDQGASNDYELLLGVTDGGGFNDLLSLVITVTNVGEPPVFTSPASVTVPENSLAAYTPTFSDPENDYYKFWIERTGDEPAFNGDTSSGTLYFDPAPDFENPTDTDGDNSYEITLKASDAEGNISASFALTVTVTDVQEDVVGVIYPSPGANIGGRYSDVTVRGQLAGLAAADVSYVDVNGVLATLDANDPPGWQATVPVNGTGASLNVEVGEAGGGTHSDSRDYIAQPLMDELYGADIDLINNRLLVTDFSKDAILSVDLTTGERSIFSAQGIGSHSILMDEPRDIGVDAANDQAFVISKSTTILRVDFASRDRIPFSNTLDTGPMFQRPSGIAMDLANNRALITDSGLDALVAMDLSNGDRTILSDSNTGGGINFSDPRGVAYDPVTDTAWVADAALQEVFEVNLANGDRSVLTDFGGDLNFRWTTPEYLAWDAANQQLLVGHTTRGIAAVDPGTGTAGFFSDLNNGSGPNLGTGNIHGLVMDAANSRLLAVDGRIGGGEVIGVDLTTGDRTQLSTNNLTADGRMSDPRGMIRLDDGLFYLMDATYDQLVAVDVENATRTVISSDSIGAGPSFDIPESLTYNPDLDEFLVVDWGLDAVIAVDPATGNRTVVSDAATGTGPLLSRPLDLVYAGSGVYVVDADLDALLYVDRSSGNRQIASDANNGIGKNFNYPRSVVYADNGNLFVADSGNQTLFEIDLTGGEGDRLVVSDSNTGSGMGLYGILDLSVDSDNNRVMAVTRNRILTIDTVTGDRAVAIQDSTIDDALDFEPARQLLYDTEEQAYWVLSYGTHGLFLVDAVTGERALAYR